MIADRELGQVEGRAVEYGDRMLVEQLRGELDIRLAARGDVVEYRFDFRSREGERSM